MALDLGLVGLDSVIYGTIYTRARNLFPAWIAHALAEITALALLLTVRGH